ncbi:hypothetical protein BD770DRAFT_324689 [Pilaira anomala]|nr:hypothetical protein BD770DRAFT_375238 [Pilaira anomala]KAI9354644.1 hypothetical protein BD770DRAFT_324689 [Pilaira anomala]
MPSDISYKAIMLYKTEKCRNWDERGFCRYGKRCRYAHGLEELRPIPRSNQYKTKSCKAYHELGTCPYGIRCTFIHNTTSTNSNKPSSTMNNNWDPIPTLSDHNYDLYYGTSLV